MNHFFVRDAAYANIIFGRKAFPVTGKDLQARVVLVKVDSSYQFKAFVVGDRVVNGYQSVSAEEVYLFDKACQTQAMEDFMAYTTKYPGGLFSPDVSTAIRLRALRDATEELRFHFRLGHYDVASALAVSTRRLERERPSSLETIYDTLSHYCLESARAAAKLKRYNAAYRFAALSNDLHPDRKTQILMDSVKQLSDSSEIQAREHIGDSLMIRRDFPGALSAFRQALRFDTTKTAVAGKVNAAEDAIQDSLFQNAKAKDLSNELVYYRKLNYENYLVSFPNGKYAGEAKSRIAKLARISSQLDRFFIIYGVQGLFSSSPFPAHHIRIGKFNESSIFSIGAEFNPDALSLRRAPFGTEKIDFTLQKSQYRAVHVDGARSSYVSRGRFFGSYSQMIGRPGKFQYFFSADMGVAWVNQWFLVQEMRSDGNSGLAPAGDPKYRVKGSPDTVISYGFGMIVNYKAFTMELGISSNKSWLGYEFATGFSF